mgnify:CR=1 FL=1
MTAGRCTWRWPEGYRPWRYFARRRPSSAFSLYGGCNCCRPGALLPTLRFPRWAALSVGSCEIVFTRSVRKNIGERATALEGRPARTQLIRHAFSAGIRDRLKSPFAQSELVQPATRRSRNYRIFSEKLSWGALPDGFNRVVDERGHRLVVRQDQVAHIDFSLCDNDRAGALADSRYHGRGVLRSIVLPDGDTGLDPRLSPRRLLSNHCHHLVFTWPPRPFRELVLTEELRRRGLRTVEVCAACVSRPAGPFYRGWLITKQLQGAEDLWSAFHSGLIERIGLTAALRAVAGGIRAMHREGSTTPILI